MIAFGSAMAGATRGVVAAETAAREALDALSGAAPKLAVAFANAAYEDLSEVPAALARVLGAVPVVGGTSGARILGTHGVLARGVSVVVLGGDGIEAGAVSDVIRTPELHEAVPAAARIATMADEAATRGYGELTCLAFAPGVIVDGAALVAAVRKGAGPRAQLAGGLTGDDQTMDRTRVFAEGRVHDDRFVLAGLFTRKPLGVAARHGWRQAGPSRTITRSDGAWLVSLDGRPAIDVWLGDAIAAGGKPPPGRGRDVALFLADHYALGLLETGRDIVVRAPFALREDGAVLLSASVPEGATHRACVVHAEVDDLLNASRDAARIATSAAGRPLAGALVLACTGRIAALGEHFEEESASIGNELQVPFGGSCVFGEIARAGREVEAFHNTTAVIVAIPAA